MAHRSSWGWVRPWVASLGGGSDDRQGEDTGAHRDRPEAEDVFAYLADVQKHKDWSPKAYRVEGLDGPVRLGTTSTSYGWVPKDPDHRNDVEVTAFEPSTRIEFTGRARRVRTS